MIVIMLSFGNDESKTIQALIFYQKEIFILAAIKRIEYRIEHCLILVYMEWKILKILHKFLNFYWYNFQIVHVWFLLSGVKS